MTRLIIRFAFFTLLPAMAVVPAPSFQAQPSNGRFEVAGVKQEEVRSFLADLQKAVKNADREAIGRMIQYPLVAGQQTKRIRLRKSADLAAQFSNVITPAVQKAVLNQKFDDLFVNARGVMIGNGEVWIGGVCESKDCRKPVLRIIAVNPG